MTNSEVQSLAKADPLSAGDVAHIQAALAAPFDPRELKLKPQVVPKDQNATTALAVVFVDARVVMDRLDEVLGVAGWQDKYTRQPDGSVMCELSCRIGGEWITKTDVGGQSEQPDEGDRDKAAVSDALKRAAVKFGVGRYIYRVPAQWIGYDTKKRRFTGTPKLPAWAVPNGPQARQLPAAKPAEGSGQPAKQLPAKDDSQTLQDAMARQTQKPPAQTPRAAHAAQAATAAANGGIRIDQRETIVALAEELRMTRDQFFAAVEKATGKKAAMGALTAPQADGLALHLRRALCDAYLTELAVNLDDVRLREPSVKADGPMELGDEEAVAALSALRAMNNEALATHGMTEVG